MSVDRYRHEPQLLGVAQQYPITVTFGQVDHIYGVALQRARARGMRADNAEDTSQEFGNCWLVALKADKLWAKRCLDSEAYLQRCADYHAQDTSAKLRGQYIREQQWSLHSEDLDAADFENRPCQQPGPDKQVIRNELCSLLSQAINRLQDRPRDIVIRRVIFRQTVITIAQEMGCTANAISLSLNASCERLERYLISTGHTEADIREYLYELFRPDLEGQR